MTASRDDDHDPLVDYNGFELTGRYESATHLEDAQYRYRLRTLLSRWRRLECGLRDDSTPGEVAAYEAAVQFGLAHLQQYREPRELIHHFWNDPQDTCTGLIEPPWIQEACQRYGGEHKLSTIAIEALAYGRRLGQLGREHLSDKGL